MRKLIVQEWISLDGYANDRHNKLDFFAHTVRDIYADDYYTTFLEDIDCILFGRKTYEQFVTLWPQRSIKDELLARIVNTARKVVFSKSLSHAPWGEWTAATVETGDPVISVMNLKSTKGKNLILWGSVSLAQLLAKAKLIDEYHLNICPTITGGGSKLFSDGLDSTILKLASIRKCNNEVVSLIYHTS